MNNLKIFNSQEFGQIRTITINGKREYIVNGTIIDRFKLLVMACGSETKEEAWELMNVASSIFHPMDDEVFNSLYGIVAMEITRKFHRNEFYYQDLFKKNYSNIREGKVIKNKSDGCNIPDAWVEKKGYIIPVEVKLQDFDNRALKQLKRYMDVYGSKKGIAVAKKLTVDLPDNIEFISFSELEGPNDKTKIS